MKLVVKGYSKHTKHGIVQVHTHERTVSTPSGMTDKTKQALASKASARAKTIQAARAAALSKRKR